MSYYLEFKNHPRLIDNLYNEYLDWRFEPNTVRTSSFGFWLKYILNQEVYLYEESFTYDGFMIFNSEEESFLFLMEWL